MAYLTPQTFSMQAGADQLVKKNIFFFKKVTNPSV